MTVGTSQRRAERDSLKGIRIRVTFAPEQMAPKDDVPTGTTKELLAWIGPSELRAKRVLARELAEASPRVRLVRALYTMLITDAPEA